MRVGGEVDDALRLLQVLQQRGKGVPVDLLVAAHSARSGTLGDRAVEEGADSVDHYVCTVDLREELGGAEDITDEPVDLCVFGVAVLEAFPECAGEYLLMARTEAEC